MYVKSVTHQRDDEPERAVGDLDAAYDLRPGRGRPSSHQFTDKSSPSGTDMSKYVKDLITDDLKKRLDGVSDLLAGRRRRAGRRTRTVALRKQLRRRTSAAGGEEQPGPPGDRGHGAGPGVRGRRRLGGGGLGRRRHRLAGQGNHPKLADDKEFEPARRPRAA